MKDNKEQSSVYSAVPWFVFGKPNRFATRADAEAYAKSLIGDWLVDWNPESRGIDNEFP